MMNPGRGFASGGKDEPQRSQRKNERTLRGKDHVLVGVFSLCALSSSAPSVVQQFAARAEMQNPG